MAKKKKHRRQAGIDRVEHEPGVAPGAIRAPTDAAATTLDVMAYGPDGVDEAKDATLARALELRGRRAMTWLDFDGLADAALIRDVGKAFGLHHLTLEDVVHPHQRAKVEYFADYIYVVLRMARAGDTLDSEQLSVVIGKSFVISFQEGKPGDCLEPVRERIRKNKAGLRAAGPDFLAYSLIDAVIDHYFPVLGGYADRLEGLEAQVTDRPYLDVIWQIHGIKRELLSLQTAMLPHRDLVQSLIREPSALVADDTRLHLRDVADHTGQILDLLASYRDMAQALIEIHLNVASNRMNEVMQVLTIFGAVFMPLSFVAGVYGMNFNTESPYNMPELAMRFGYPVVLAVMVLIAGGLLYYFKRRGWLRPPR